MNKQLFKKMISLLIIGLLSVTIISGCSKVGAVGDQVLVKVGTVVSGQNPANVALEEVFKPMIEEATDGKFNVQIYTSGQLGGEKQLWDFTRSGIVEVSVIGTVMWSEVPVMATPDFPFMFRDVPHARKVYQGEVGRDIADTLEEQEPVQFAAWLPNGARVFSSSKPLESVEDFKGLRIRMPNNPIHVTLAESLGANSIIMDMGEVFSALDQNVVDGQDNPLQALRQEGWYTVQDYVYETNHIVSSLELFISNEFWDTLTDEEKEIFRKAAEATSDKAWDLYEESIENDRAFMEENGLKVTAPTEEDREKMIEMVQPVYDMLYKKYDWAEDMIERIREVE